MNMDREYYLGRMPQREFVRRIADTSKHDGQNFYNRLITDVFSRFTNLNLQDIESVLHEMNSNLALVAFPVAGLQHDPDQYRCALPDHPDVDFVWTAIVLRVMPDENELDLSRQEKIERAFANQKIPMTYEQNWERLIEAGLMIPIEGTRTSYELHLRQN